MKKHYFYHGGKKRRFFPFFQCEISCYCAELFECVFEFKFLKTVARRCSSKPCNIHWKTPVFEPYFDKVVGFFRTPFFNSPPLLTVIAVEPLFLHKDKWEFTRMCGYLNISQSKHVYVCLSSHCPRWQSSFKIYICCSTTLRSNFVINFKVNVFFFFNFKRYYVLQGPVYFL